MRAAEIIRDAMMDGVNLALSGSGKIKASGNREALDRWISLISEHKPAILEAVRRQKVIAMLEAAPGTQRAIYVDDASDPENITLTIAVRHPAGATCEMLIPRSKYDSWKFLELLERLVQTTH
jgi:hypothetical protein